VIGAILYLPEIMINTVTCIPTDRQRRNDLVNTFSRSNAPNNRSPLLVNGPVNTPP
jgi:hypothetical protein